MSYCNPQGKILWHLDRVHSLFSTGSTDPLLFEIDPSNKCNQNCPWCAFSKLRSASQEMMCRDSLLATVDQLKELNVKAINWTGGGEPLMNPHTTAAISRAHRLGIDQGIFTNGLLMKKDVANLLAINMTWIRISLDGFDEDSYAKSHGTSEKCFGKVLDNIRYLASLKKRCTVGVGFVINDHNYWGIDTVVKLAKEMKVDYVQLKPVAYRPGEEQISTDKIRWFYQDALKAQKHATDDFEVMIAHYRFKDMMLEDRGRQYKKCLSHHLQGAVGADSKVYICDHHKGEPQYELGDLKKNTMKEIWNSDQRAKVIEYLDSTDLSQCQDCCRNHELNKTLWHIANKDQTLHPNHI